MGVAADALMALEGIAAYTLSAFDEGREAALSVELLSHVIAHFGPRDLARMGARLRFRWPVPPGDDPPGVARGMSAESYAAVVAAARQVDVEKDWSR